jgi:hypothetical protein
MDPGARQDSNATLGADRTSPLFDLLAADPSSRLLSEEDPHGVLLRRSCRKGLPEIVVEAALSGRIKIWKTTDRSAS